MYTGRYSSDGDVEIPEGYDGTMLSERDEVNAPDIEAREPSTTAGILSGIFPGGIEKILGFPILKDFKIGIEEILIGATALFLLTSRNGDKECALMLLLLLFVR